MGNASSHYFEDPHSTPESESPLRSPPSYSFLGFLPFPALLIREAPVLVLNLAFLSDFV